MSPRKPQRESVLHELEHAGGLRPGVSKQVHQSTGTPEAEVFGTASFYHLLANPDYDLRVCQGLSCQLADCSVRREELEANGSRVGMVSCLGRCDQPPAVWDPNNPATGTGHVATLGEGLALDLEADDESEYRGLARAREEGFDWVLEQLEQSGLVGRGGAGFPTHFKWRTLQGQAETERYVVLNADEGEPGTFKDREVILRRPQLVIEGLAIAAETLGAHEIYCYVRGEFGHVREALENALNRARERADLSDSLTWHFVDGHGAYICGEETALIEALEGRRGMPRLRPPYPVELGFRGKPTLVQNVETIACLPGILRRGGEWFRDLGRGQGGTKLYCLSGHVARPGVYEAPLGVSLAELLPAAGGVVGTLKAFSPGGASSGFLPADQVDLPLDFKHLGEAGSMLGSAGIVVLNDTVDMVEAALIQAVFFEDESCGQCAPCRIGTQILRQTLERYQDQRDPSVLSHLDDVMWGMGEASICGLGQAAFFPLQSAIKYFPAEFGAAG